MGMLPQRMQGGQSAHRTGYDAEQSVGGEKAACVAADVALAEAAGRWKRLNHCPSL